MEDKKTVTISNTIIAENIDAYEAIESDQRIRTEKGPKYEKTGCSLGIDCQPVLIFHPRIKNIFKRACIKVSTRPLSAP